MLLNFSVVCADKLFTIFGVIFSFTIFSHLPVLLDSYQTLLFSTSSCVTIVIMCSTPLVTFIKKAFVMFNEMILS